MDKSIYFPPKLKKTILMKPLRAKQQAIKRCVMRCKECSMKATATNLLLDARCPEQGNGVKISGWVENFKYANFMEI